MNGSDQIDMSGSATSAESDALSTYTLKRLGHRNPGSYFTDNGGGAFIDLSAINNSPLRQGIPNSAVQLTVHSRNGSEVLQRVAVGYASAANHAVGNWTTVAFTQTNGNSASTCWLGPDPASSTVLRGPYFLRVFGARHEMVGSADDEPNEIWRLDGWEYSNGWTVDIGCINHKAADRVNPQVVISLAITKS